MGGLCNSQTKREPVSSATSTSMPGWVQQGGKKIFDQAWDLSQQPYQGYTGDRIADQSQGMLDAAQGMRDVDYSAGTEAAEGLMNFSPRDVNAGSVTAGTTQLGDLDSYMNPYIENVADRTMSELERARAIQQRRIDDRMIGAGGFGGARHGVADAETNRNFADVAGNQLASLYSGGHDRAMSAMREDLRGDVDRRFAGDQFNAELDMRGQRANQDADVAGANINLGALSGFGSMQDREMNRQSMLYDIGQREQALEQQGLDTAYQDFLNQQRWPYEQINFSMGALSGVPYPTSQMQTSEQIVQQPSTIGQIGGLGLAAAGMFM